MDNDSVFKAIERIDSSKAQRFKKLRGDAQEIATEAIIKYIRACRKLEVNPESIAIGEIIDDASLGQNVSSQANSDNAQLKSSKYK